MVSAVSRMQLDDIVPWGRSLSEYRRLFDLSGDDLSRTILGCGDGPASFNAEMTALGHTVISIDPLYASSAADIRRRITETYDTVIELTRAAAVRFVWCEFADVDALGKARLTAMERFLQDYDAGSACGRYRAESLPASSCCLLAGTHRAQRSVRRGSRIRSSRTGQTAHGLKVGLPGPAGESARIRRQPAHR